MRPSTMHRKELAQKIASVLSNEVNATDAELVLHTAEDQILEALCTGRRVTLTDFGSFQPQPRAARHGRHPVTGEPLDIPATVLPVWKPTETVRTTVARRRRPATL